MWYAESRTAMAAGVTECFLEDASHFSCLYLTERPPESMSLPVWIKQSRRQESEVRGSDFRSGKRDFSVRRVERLLPLQPQPNPRGEWKSWHPIKAILILREPRETFIVWHS